MLSAVSRAKTQVLRRRTRGRNAARAVDLAAKVAEQQRTHGRVHQIPQNGGHGQRPEMGAHHREGKARQHRAGFNHADLVELQLFFASARGTAARAGSPQRQTTACASAVPDPVCSTLAITSLSRNTSTKQISPAPRSASRAWSAPAG